MFSVILERQVVEMNGITDKMLEILILHSCPHYPQKYIVPPWQVTQSWSKELITLESVFVIRPQMH